MMPKPCRGCPFLKVGGVRVTRARAREIIGNMLSPHGGSFTCHETAVHDEDGEYTPTKNEKHCAGAAIFADKNGSMTQMLRISGRLGLYRPDDHKPYWDSVFDTRAQMLKEQFP